jgi:hypothetical protein
MLRRLIDFPPFPNHHVRTNAFIVERDLLRRLRIRAARDKLDAWKFECGWVSLTRQIEGSGLRSIVVGRDGRTFTPEEWPQSHTLWQGQQENLLIADNQTDSYRNGDVELREVLSAFAWGLDAEPTGVR